VGEDLGRDGRRRGIGPAAGGRGFRVRGEAGIDVRWGWGGRGGIRRRRHHVPARRHGMARRGVGELRTQEDE
jgi:hypothetical protein